jgi:hypothetical protein
MAIVMLRVHENSYARPSCLCIIVFTRGSAGLLIMKGEVCVCVCVSVCEKPCEEFPALYR